MFEPQIHVFGSFSFFLKETIKISPVRYSEMYAESRSYFYRNLEISPVEANVRKISQVELIDSLMAIPINIYV